MTNGVLTLNGVTDEDLIKILEAKRKEEGTFQFNAQQ